MRTNNRLIDQKSSFFRIIEQNESLNDLAEIELCLSHLIKVNKVNLEGQEIYLDILQHKNKKINSHYIRNIYRLFTENKANEIYYEKKMQGIKKVIKNKALTRYYVRLIEISMRKILYYWMNSTYLGFLSVSVLSFTKQLDQCLKKLLEIQNLEIHKEFIKLFHKQNMMIQEQIYELLINLGYLASMDQFYRINGVELVPDQIYQMKEEQNSEPYVKYADYISENSLHYKQNTHSNKRKRESQIKESKELRKLKENRSSVSRLTIVPEKNIATNMKIKRLFEKMAPQVQKYAINHASDSLSKQHPQETHQNKKQKDPEVKLECEKGKKRTNSKRQNTIYQQTRKQSLKNLIYSPFSEDIATILKLNEPLTIERASEVLIKSEKKHKKQDRKDNFPRTSSIKVGKIITLLQKRQQEKFIQELSNQVGDKALQFKSYRPQMLFLNRSSSNHSQRFNFNSTRSLISLEKNKILIRKFLSPKKKSFLFSKRQKQKLHQINKKIFENQIIFKELNPQKKQQYPICKQLLFYEKGNRTQTGTPRRKSNKKPKKQKKNGCAKSLKISRCRTDGVKYLIYDRRARTILPPH